MQARFYNPAIALFTQEDDNYNKNFNHPKVLRIFMSKAEYKQFKKFGFTYDPQDSRQGISATVTHFPPKDPDKIIYETGARGADYYVDIDVIKGNTKQGNPDFRIKDDVTPDDIVVSGQVRKNRGAKL